MSLKLDSVESINHNTKKFRFAFEDSDAISGLNVASALVTKFKPEGAEKPVIRPYTPTSDEGECWETYGMICTWLTQQHR